MANKKEKRGLGRGLSALMADIEPVEVRRGGNTGLEGGERQVPISRVRANPDQPRKTFDEQELRELSRSIAEKGIIQPLIVRPDPSQPNQFQIVAGERRWRAAQLAKVDSVPVLVRALDDLEVLEIAIIENIQRADLNPVDEAASYQQLMDKFGHTQEKLSEALGKSRSHIANMLRLLGLPEPILGLLRGGNLSTGHARALITAPNQLDLAREVIAKGLSVRQTEALVKRAAQPKKEKKAAPVKDADTRSLEVDLSANLGMKVAIAHRDGSENGAVTIKYKTFDELDEICRILSITHSAGSK
ncbi:MAG: ParB/RepB/Spo0J family partition protein [Rhodobacteraceae bacterium]|nr:ParB/RepB/Spo0J family partition protein [Paracoccaceae bacterium]